jgi:hypothetical protein
MAASRVIIVITLACRHHWTYSLLGSSVSIDKFDQEAMHLGRVVVC